MITSGRPIRPDEPSGVLYPRNLRRYDAQWFDPDPTVRQVVDQYWSVRWELPAGVAIDQWIIDAPAVTVSLEQGDVPAPLVVTGPHRRAWTRQIVGTGMVFGIRLRPAGLAVLSDLSPGALADATIPLTSELDVDLYELASSIAAAPTPQARVAVADATIRDRLSRRPLDPHATLANAVVEALRTGPHPYAGADVADRFGVSERTIQRALARTLGAGPKSVGRRIRLQAVARGLAAGQDIGALASELGYSDQAHLTRDFRSIAGISPAAYIAAMGALVGPLPPH